jgi:hypothetical protein
MHNLLDSQGSQGYRSGVLAYGSSPYPGVIAGMLVKE